jgi:hypothetical protein
MAVAIAINLSELAQQRNGIRVRESARLPLWQATNGRCKSFGNAEGRLPAALRLGDVIPGEVLSSKAKNSPISQGNADGAFSGEKSAHRRGTSGRLS